MLYHCLKICRILLKLYIQSTEQMWLWAHMPFSTSCFTVAEHRLGVTASAHRVLEAAARSCSWPEYAPVSPSRSPEHTAGWCASDKLTGHSAPLPSALWLHSSLGNLLFCELSTPRVQLPTALSTSSSRRKVLEHSPAGCSGSRPSQNLQKW